MKHGLLYYSVESYPLHVKRRKDEGLYSFT